MKDKESIYKWTCPCGKEIKSLSQSQFDWNKKQHTDSCKVAQREGAK